MPVKPETVDQYLDDGCGRCPFGATPRCKARAWRPELEALREILRESGLTEEIKWSAPCYTDRGNNVAMLSALRDGVVLSFFRGGQLRDPRGWLRQPGEHSQRARVLRFADTTTIAARRDAILDFVRQAVELERGGAAVEVGEPALPDAPAELSAMLAADPAFAAAFAALTPGRRRGYLIHFSSARQAKTRVARIERCQPAIFAGKGWNER